MRKILTIYADDFNLNKIQNEKIYIKNIKPKELSLSIFKKICEDCSKEKFEVIVIYMYYVESHLELIQDLVYIAKNYKIMLSIISFQEIQDKQLFLKTGLFYLAYTEKEKQEMFLSIINILDIYRPIRNSNIIFTEKEKTIFELLEKNKSNVVSYLDIKQEYLDKDAIYVYSEEMNSIKSLIYKIKKKIELIDLEIINVRNEGYKLIDK